MFVRKTLIAVFVLSTAALAVLAQTPQAIETELLGYAENLGKYGTYAGAYDEHKLNKANELMRQKLLIYGKRADVLKYGFPKVKGGGELYVATSRDGRF